MSRNPHQRHPYGRPHPHPHPNPNPQPHPQHPQQQQQHQQQQQPLLIPSIPTTHFPSPSTLPLPNLQLQTMTSIPQHHIPILARLPDAPSASLHQASSPQESGMFESLASNQSHNPPLYSDSQALPHPAFPGSTTQHQQQPLTELYSPSQHSRSQYSTPTWPTDYSQPQISSHRPQPAYHPHHQLPKYPPSATRSPPLKRKRQTDPLPSPAIRTAATITTTPPHPTPGSSTDTRRGRERVQRPCGNCGEMNHIRKNKCARCDAPKEPAKKRTKRQRKKKVPPAPVQPEATAAVPTSTALLLPDRQSLVPDLSQVPINRAPSLIERQDPRQDTVQPVFDPRALSFAHGPQPQGPTTVETQPTHPTQPGQRSAPDFSTEAPFDDSQGNFSQP